MTWPERLAILLDGEYATKTLGKRLKRFPVCAEVMAEVRRILDDPALAGMSLYRILYYTAEPLAGTATHPLDGARINFSETVVFSRNRQLIDQLENAPDVAVRRGTLAHQGWQLGHAAIKALTTGQRSTVLSPDIVPKIQQKGVDMRIGLDIASLALKRLVSTVVIVSGDSDLVPAMKFARREGLRVFLDTLGSPQVRPELKVHADRLL